MVVQTDCYEGRQPKDERNVFHLERHDLAVFVLRVDQLQHADHPLAVIHHRDHQHGAGAVAVQHIVLLGSCKIIGLGPVNVRQADDCLVQRGAGAHMLPSQRHGRQVDATVSGAAAYVEGFRDHIAEIQIIPILCIYCPAVAVRDLHRVAQDIFQQQVNIMLCRQIDHNTDDPVKPHCLRRRFRRRLCHFPRPPLTPTVSTHHC